jgi:thiamine biosynthesis lipoprotein
MQHTAAAPAANLGGTSMGTRWSVRLFAPPSLDLHLVHLGIQAELDRVVAQMSTWEADSDISRHAAAAPGSWLPIPADFAAVLDCAIEIAAGSDGAFDPSIGPLVQLWGFGSQRRQRQVPDPREVEQARILCGWQRVQRRNGGRELFQPGQLQLDLSAIAKGYGADLVASYLQSQQFDAALVEVGGEIRAFGRKPDGAPWRVLVESDLDEAAGLEELTPRVLQLDDVAVATSGDRWHHFLAEGVRYAHTFDPRRGAPVLRAAASVTVVERSAMRADAWATALTVMGPDQGLAFANEHGLAARFVWREGAGLHERSSDTFAQYLTA